MKKKIQIDRSEVEEFKNNVVYLDSPLGTIEIQSDNDEIVILGFVEEKLYNEKPNSILEDAKAQLQEYFNGERKDFNLPIKTSGTEFQKKVWQELTKIPYGETYSYKDVAIGVGNEKASRAIGNTNNKNKIAIVIPCHRVVGSNGKLVGYEGGLWRKKWLLEHEGKFL